MSVPLWRVVNLIGNLGGMILTVEPLRVPPLEGRIEGNVEIVVKRVLMELESTTANRFRVFGVE